MVHVRPLEVDDRAISEVVGYVLLIGMVLLATGVAVVIGSQAISGLQAENDATAARPVLEEIDAEFTSLAASGDAPATTFDFSETAGDSLSVQREGRLNVTVFPVDDTEPHCSAVATLGSIRFEEDSRVVAYEGGGLWERSPAGGTAMVSPPDVAFREGSLDVSLINVTGHMNAGQTDARFNQTLTAQRNSAHENELANCETVDRVQITVNSTFYEAWGRYLEEQTGATATTVGTQSVRVELTSTHLPRRTDMQNNTVVNVTNPDYMTDNPGATGYTDGNSPRHITVNKGAPGNSYLVSVSSLSERRPQISEIRSLTPEDVSNFSRDPVDVAFIIDLSGSMNQGSSATWCPQYGTSQNCPDDEDGDGNLSDPGERIHGAQDAAKVAVGTMNTSVIGDRATVIGYNLSSRQLFADGRYFTSDAGELNRTFDDLYAVGGTNFADALNESIATFQYRDNYHEAHILLLTDGRQDIPSSMCHAYNFGSSCRSEWDERARDAARLADSRGYTVHTFAYGNDAEIGTLQDISSISGGQFNYSANGDELEAVFGDVLGNLTSNQDYVTRTPITTNLSSGGEVHPPEIVGDTDPLATTTGPGGETFLNINDPTSPTLFSHSFTVDDGDQVVLNATKFDCAEDGWVDTGTGVEVGGTTLPLARCTEIVATNQSLDDSRIEIYQTGDDATPLMTNEDINETLDEYTDGSDTFDLASNQVVVNLNFEATAEFENNLVLLYQIGLSEDDVRGADVVNLQESTITLE